MYTASVLPDTPESYSNALIRHIPTGSSCDAVPLVTVAPENNLTSLYGVVSPLTLPMSGVLYKFVILTKLPNSRFVTPALIVVTSLALFKSLNVVPIFSNSYPLTYALPAEHDRASKSSEAVPPSSVVAPLEYTPEKSTPSTVLLILSLESNKNGLTV